MSKPMATMRPWRTKPPERIQRTRTKSPVERPGFFVRAHARSDDAAAPGGCQGMAVIGRNSRTTLVTSVQSPLDRMKRRKFSMRRLLFVRKWTPEPAILFRPFAFCGADLPRRHSVDAFRGRRALRKQQRNQALVPVSFS
jgi:hypothetical protein